MGQAQIITQEEEEEEEKCNSIVLDTSALIHIKSSIAIITQYTTKVKNKIYTVPGVIKELRDDKSRSSLLEMNMNDIESILEIREPTKNSMNVIIHFSKCTGDYNHLSLVDLQLLALLYEFEEEGCGVNNMNNIRYEPKNVIGKGKIELLLQKQEEEEEEDNENDDDDDNNNNKKEILLRE